jgi:hypothetical protein
MGQLLLLKNEVGAREPLGVLVHLLATQIHLAALQSIIMHPHSTFVPRRCAYARPCILLLMYFSRNCARIGGCDWLNTSLNAGTGGLVCARPPSAGVGGENGQKTRARRMRWRDHLNIITVDHSGTTCAAFATLTLSAPVNLPADLGSILIQLGSKAER